MLKKVGLFFQGLGKSFKRVGIAALALFGVMGLTTHFAHAAADPQLTASLATTTSMIKDSAYAFIPYILGVFSAVIVLVLIIKGIMWGIKKIKGTIR